MEDVLEVNILSKELIKPASPTPPHLQFYQLSFLDQITVPVFMPLVLFYSNEFNTTNIEKLKLIKQSLSHALTHFYPLAGRVKGDTYIDCNDEGVYFVEAQANFHLQDLLQSPNPGNNNKLLPLELDDVRDLVCVLQVTFFTCGGVAIGFEMYHKVGDALSMFMFVNTWACIARDGCNVAGTLSLPCFNSSTLFPPRDISGFQHRTGIVKDKVVSKRFVFDASTISSIRAKYTDESSPNCMQDRPTRVEALSAFVWSRFVASTKPESDANNKIYTVTHAVNLRPRMDPPLPNTYFGNISRLAIAVPNVDGDNSDGCYGIVKLMKDAIRNVNVDYVKSNLQESHVHLNFLKERSKQVVRGEVVSFSFTSLCRFPMYDADFGWGKPVWIGSAKLTFKNLVTFFDTKEGGGIEVWINLMEEDMSKLEMDKEILAHLSSNTNVSIIPRVK